jgi:hypothetical protein
MANRGRMDEEVLRAVNHVAGLRKRMVRPLAYSATNSSIPPIGRVAGRPAARFPDHRLASRVNVRLKPSCPTSRKTIAISRAIRREGLLAKSI